MSNIKEKSTPVTKISTPPEIVKPSPSNSLRSKPSKTYRVYETRWVLLANAMVLVAASELTFFTFPPITYLAARYLEEDVKTIQFLTTIFIISSLPWAILGTWLIDAYGIRATLFLSGGSNALGCIIRAVGVAYPNENGSRLICVLIGQIISSCSVAALLVPTKLAAMWFPESQRAKANFFATVSNPIGVLIAMFFIPIIVENRSEKVELILILTCFPPIMGLIMTTEVYQIQKIFVNLSV